MRNQESLPIHKTWLLSHNLSTSGTIQLNFSTAIDYSIVTDLNYRQNLYDELNGCSKSTRPLFIVYQICLATNIPQFPPPPPPKESQNSMKSDVK